VTDELVSRYAEGPADDVGATLRTLGEMADAQEARPLAPRLADLRCEVLMLVGSAPHHSGPSVEELQLLGARIPGYRQLMVEGAGHYLQEERPDVVIQALTRFQPGAKSAWPQYRPTPMRLMSRSCLPSGPLTYASMLELLSKLPQPRVRVKAISDIFPGGYGRAHIVTRRF
jgi:hypothetical protein